MASETADDVKQPRTQSRAFIAAMVFCAAAAIIFGAMVFAKGGGSGDKIEPLGSINPNEASAASLARLPGIGVGRAKAVVDYRVEYAARGGQGCAFKDSNDLDKVKGIGPATVEKIKQWLEFE